MNSSHIPNQNRCWYQKVFQNSIKSSGYAGGSRKLPHKYAEHRLWPSNIYLGKILGPVHIWWYRQLYEYLHRYTQFRIYDAKEYIRTSFPEISYPQHRGLSLRYCLYSSRKRNRTSLNLSVMSSQSPRQNIQPPKGSSLVLPWISSSLCSE